MLNIHDSASEVTPTETSVKRPTTPVQSPKAQKMTMTEPHSPVDLQALETMETYLFAKTAGACYSYHRVPWKLEIRKEVGNLKQVDKHCDIVLDK